MSFKKIVENLQKAEENEGFLILIRCGVFFVGVGKDAVILTENLGVTNICFTDGVCKSGIPVNRIDKMLAKIINKNISAAIYDYNPKGLEKDKNKKYDLLRRIVMSPIHETRKCLDCGKCIYHDMKPKSNLASTEEVIKRIDNILEENNKVIDIENKTNDTNNKTGNSYGR